MLIDWKVSQKRTEQNLRVFTFTNPDGYPPKNIKEILWNFLVRMLQCLKKEFAHEKKLPIISPIFVFNTAQTLSHGQLKIHIQKEAFNYGVKMKEGRGWKNVHYEGV